MKEEKVIIIYKPSIDDEERRIFEDTFGADNVSYGQYKTKGMEAAAYDVQIIIDLLNTPYLTAGLNLVGIGTIVKLLGKTITKLFDRNNQKIADKQTRPRYTILSIKMEKQWINISNVNNETKIKISRTTANAKLMKKDMESGEQEYSEDKLEEYLKEEMD